MSTRAEASRTSVAHDDRLIGSARAHALDRWIFVITAAGFVAIALAGFLPDSVMKLSLIKAGLRPPFPLVAHIHAALMGSFLLFVLFQTVLMATGRDALHRRTGQAAKLLVPALIAAGLLLVPTTWHTIWGAAHHAPPEARPALLTLSSRLDNIMLLQLRIAVLFSLFIFLGLRARTHDAGRHKRLMMIAPAMALPAAFDRITWIPTTFPANPLSTDFYPLLALAPMILWDVIRNRRIHPVYGTLMAIYVPAAILVHIAWDQQWWHDTAHRIMGV